MEKKEQTVSINLSEVEIKDLNGLNYTKDLPKLVENYANVIYTSTKTIELLHIAMKLHKRKAADVEKLDLADIITIVSTTTVFAPWIQSQFVEYLSEKLKQFKD